MKDLRPNVRAILVGLGLVLALEINWLQREYVAANQARKAWSQKEQEWEVLAGRTPVPDAANEGLLATELTEADRSLERWMVQWSRPGQAISAPPPELPVEGFLALAEFVVRNQRRAEEQNVALSASERFGFETYAREGPPAALLPAIHRQMGEVEILISLLLAARPRALLALKRTEPSDQGLTSPGDRTSSTGLLPITSSVQSPGLIATDLFRIEFSGRTPTLRIFLKALAESKQPTIVRLVEVEPDAAHPVNGERGDDHNDDYSDAPFSRFKVVVEIPRLLVGGQQS